MKRLLFMVEGQTDVEFLEAFLPYINIPPHLSKILKFDSKSKVLCRFVDKLESPEVQAAVVLVDQDNLAKQDKYSTCKDLKAEFEAKLTCGAPGLRKPVKIRIACEEREAWYLGDIAALKEAYPYTQESTWKEIGIPPCPDTLRYPSEYLKGIQGFKHTDAARKMGRILGRKCAKNGGYGDNRSASFRYFVKAARDIKRMK